MKINICIIIFTGILITGCGNIPGTLKIKGKIIDEFTKVPIPGKDVIVFGLVKRSNALIPINAGYFSSDSSGCFTYSFRKIKDAYSYNFYLVGDSDYSFKTEQLALTYLEKNSRNLSFSLKRLADLTILISRKSKTPACDTLFLSWKTDGIDGRAIYPYKIHNFGITTSSELKWIGENVKSTVKTRAFADQWTIIRWVLTRNGKNMEIIDTIICKRDLINKVYLEY